MTAIASVTPLPVTATAAVTPLTWGYDGVTACDGPEGLGSCSGCGADLLESDGDMPGDLCTDCGDLALGDAIVAVVRERRRVDDN